MKVAVFGLGYVGAVTAACLAADGHEVCGVDVDPVKVSMIEEGRSPVVEPGLTELIKSGRRAGRLRATTLAIEAVNRADVSILCVGTPSTPQGGANLAHLHRAVYDLETAMVAAEPGPSGLHAVVVRSTVPPGTVEEISRLLVSRPGRLGTRVGVAMCPEFLREGTGISDFHSPPCTIIGASDPGVVDLVQRLFCFADRPVHVVDLRTAEALKYACNAFHATKVSFTNELGRIFRHLGIDTRKVMELFCEDDQLNISSRYLRPGFAFGGSCLPKDLRTLLHLARMESVDLPLLAGALTTNRLSVADVIDRVVAGEGRTVAILGLSFKVESDDLRESPYVEVAETLLGKGYEVRVYDPIVNPSALRGANREHLESRLPHLRRILRRQVSEALVGADAVIVSYSSPEVVEALVSNRPSRIIDLDGRLGAEVEGLAGYEGVAW